MTITERVSYLKGLSEGLGLDKETKEGKILSVMMEILEDVGLSIADLEENQLALGDEMDELSDDLAKVEDIVYEEDEDFDEEDEDEDGDYFEVECPNCEEKITIDEDILASGGITCPNCGEKLEFDLGEGGCGCGCDHDHGDEE